MYMIIYTHGLKIMKTIICVKKKKKLLIKFKKNYHSHFVFFFAF